MWEFLSFQREYKLFKSPKFSKKCVNRKPEHSFFLDAFDLIYNLYKSIVLTGNNALSVEPKVCALHHVFYIYIFTY